MFLDCCSLLCVECLCWCIGVKILYPLLLQGLGIYSIHHALTICLNNSIQHVSNFLTFSSFISLRSI